MLKQNFGVTNKEHYDMLWYFLEWSIGMRRSHKLRACFFGQIMNIRLMHAIYINRTCMNKSRII